MTLEEQIDRLLALGLTDDRDYARELASIMLAEELSDEARFTLLLMAHRAGPSFKLNSITEDQVTDAVTDYRETCARIALQFSETAGSA